MSYRILFNDGIIFIGGTLYRDDALPVAVDKVTVL